MPLTAIPSDGLKKEGFAIGFTTISSAPAPLECTSSQSRANGLVHSSAWVASLQRADPDYQVWNIRPAPWGGQGGRGVPRLPGGEGPHRLRTGFRHRLPVEGGPVPQVRRTGRRERYLGLGPCPLLRRSDRGGRGPRQAMPGRLGAHDEARPGARQPDHLRPLRRRSGQAGGAAHRNDPDDDCVRSHPRSNTWGSASASRPAEPNETSAPLATSPFWPRSSASYDRSSTGLTFMLRPEVP